MYQPPATLPEDLLLLCASPDDGRLRLPNHFRFAVAGGVLTELLAAGAATLDGTRLLLLNPGPLGGHPALNAASAVLARHAGPPRGARLRTCVNRLGRRAAEPYLASLVQRGLAERRAWKLLGVVPIARYTATSAGLAARKLLTAQVADAVENPAAPARAFRLAALANAGELTGRLYPGPVTNRRARGRLADLTRHDPVATAVHHAVRSAKQAAASS